MNMVIQESPSDMFWPAAFLMSMGVWPHFERPPEHTQEWGRGRRDHCSCTGPHVGLISPPWAVVMSVIEPLCLPRAGESTFLLKDL
jgi:hypothetical protein